MLKSILSLVLSIGLSSAAVHADVIVEESGSKSIFKVNDSKVSPVQAQEAARNNSNKVERCTPIKDAVFDDVAAPKEAIAYRCKRVVLVINPKTGTTKWKNI